MTSLALVASLLVLIVNAMLRAAGASLVRTPRANALHDAAEGNARAGTVAELLDDRPRIQPALGIFHAGLMVLSAIPATWAMTSLFSGLALLTALIVLAMTARRSTSSMTAAPMPSFGAPPHLPAVPSRVAANSVSAASASPA